MSYPFFGNVDDRNPTPHQLAVSAAVVVSLLNLLTLFSLGLLRVKNPFLVSLFLSPITVMIGAYLVFIYGLQTFIYRKIKVIYKSIHHFRTPKTNKDTPIDINKHILDEVQQEVVKWAAEKSVEIASLKRLEQFRRDFMGNISHELKTPIFNIQGYIYTLLDGGLEDKNINMAYLQRAADNTERLNNIVQDLITISQLESDEIQLEIKKFDITLLAKEVIQELEVMAAAKKISLRFKDPLPSAFWVMADRERIRQVFVNLVTNSIKYGKQGGMVQFYFYDMDTHFLIELADNGIGIPADKLPRVFERFFRRDAARSREEGGTGLGLSIVKHILEAHQESIHVRSTIGVGTTFGFTLDKAK